MMTTIILMCVLVLLLIAMCGVLLLMVHRRDRRLADCRETIADLEEEVRVGGRVADETIRENSRLRDELRPWRELAQHLFRTGREVGFQAGVRTGLDGTAKNPLALRTVYHWTIATIRPDGRTAHLTGGIDREGLETVRREGGDLHTRIGSDLLAFLPDAERPEPQHKEQVP